MAANYLLDKEQLGLALRKLRIDAGYRNAKDLSDALASHYGLSVTPRMIYYIESGQNLPRLDLFSAYQALCYEQGIEDALLRVCWTGN